jgi:signal peptidase I
MDNILSNKYFRFTIAAIIYFLIIIWIGNYWLFIGLAVLFDVYVSKKMTWTFWKKEMAKTALLLNGWMH